jgi:DNA repair protein RadC
MAATMARPLAASTRHSPRPPAADGEPSPSYTVKQLPAAERPRERLLSGDERISDAELLAIILRVGAPGKMVTELAAELLEKFGGFWGLERASVEQLARERGLKGAKIAQLKAAIAIGRRMAHSAPDLRPQITSPEDVERLVRFDMAALEQEEMWVLLLDTKHRLLGRPRPVYRGSVNNTSVRIAELFREAVRENAVAIVLVHNHPSGDPTPSPEDVRVTGDVRRAGEQLDVELLDHVIVARSGCVSLKQRRLGFA